MKPRLGFSLIEVVLLMFLSGIILLMVSKLTKQAFEASRMLDEKAQTMQSARMGLEALSSELREAVEVALSPDALEAVTITKVSPSAKQALGIQIEGLDLSSAQEAIIEGYKPDGHGYLEAGLDKVSVGTVKYFLNDSQELIRKAEYDERLLETSVATGVSAFTVEAKPQLSSYVLPENAYRITLSIEEKRIVKTFTTIVLAPGLKS